MAQDLPVFDIVETLGDNDEVTSSYLRPTSTFDAKIQQIIEAQEAHIEEKEKEKENQKISKPYTKKIIRQSHERKIKEINETYFKDEEELTETETSDAQRHISNDRNSGNNKIANNSAFQYKEKKNKKSVRFNDNKLEEVKSIENRFANMSISEDIVNQDLSKMTFAEFKRGFLLNSIDDKKNQNNQKIDILPSKNQDISNGSGKGLYDILEEQKRSNINSKETQMTKSSDLQNGIPQITKEAIISPPPRRKVSKFKNANDEEKVQILKKRSSGAVSQISGKKGTIKDLSSLSSLSKKPIKKKTTKPGTVKIAKPELKPYFLQDVKPNILDISERAKKYDCGDEQGKQHRSIVEIVNAGPESVLTMSEINLENGKDLASDTHTQEASANNDTKFKENEQDNDNYDDEQPIKETEYPVTKVDYYSLNNDIDGMVSAYMMGMYDDDLGIEYDMPNSIIEHEQDLEKYNMQVELIERELAKEQEREKSKKQSGPNSVNIPQKDNTDNGPNSIEREAEVDNQPLLSDQIVEREVAVDIEDFETRINDYEIIEDSDSDNDDYSFNPDVVNQEIAKTYQNLRQYLINKDSGFAREKEQEIEPIDEFGNPVKLSRFKTAQIRPYVDGL